MTTGQATVPVNTPFTIRLEFTVKAGAGGGGSGSYGGMVFDARNTAGFLPGAAIFDLPAGFTANSAGGLIVNNATVGGPGGAAVPLPAAAWLGLGLLGILGAARRRSRRRS